MLTVATALLAHASIAGIVTRVGHPAATLDDAYIHFQYARAIAEGHPLRFHAGEPLSTGATSFAWPLLLAPFYAVGFRGDSILWPAWTLSFLALSALAREAYELAEPLTGRAAALGAAAMTLFFGGYVWCAASGMEVLVFAWIVAFATRCAAVWAERPIQARTTREASVLLLLAVAAPFVRPEGAITSVVLGIAVLAFPTRAPRIRRTLAVPVLVAPILPNLVLWALTGLPTTSTAAVKLLVSSPYYDPVGASLANARLLVTSILDGGTWSAEFLPQGGGVIAILGLFAIAYRGRAAARPFRAAAILIFAITIFVPCTYVTFLWNRLRYLWPFAAPWFIGLACLARAVSDAAGRAGVGRPEIVSGSLAFAFVVPLVTRLGGVLDDVAQSASGIARQQASLGRWAAEHLPAGARIGVNDTGAIAYFGGRPTFDVVGLTTPSEGRYWVAGPGSRLEHYERLRQSSPSSLPTHFIVYPEWMACPAVLGDVLHEAVVRDATILGGQVMTVYEARWTSLGTGARPWSETSAIVDEVDVADLESEASHEFELLGAREGEQVAEEDLSENGQVVSDGGRSNRTADRFRAGLEGASRGIARLRANAPLTLRVTVGTTEIATLTVEPGPWTELRFDLPVESRTRAARVTITAEGGTFDSFHYWFR